MTSFENDIAAVSMAGKMVDSAICELAFAFQYTQWLVSDTDARPGRGNLS